jgi:hypothetical protein
MLNINKIMKRININILLAATLLFGMQACKKSVDLFPTDFINEANVFQTVADLEQGLYAAYGSLPGETNMYVNAIIADETKISNENRGQGQFEFKWQYVPAQGGSASGSWTSYYYVIGLINKELAAFDKVVPKNATETTLKDRIRGELLALRGYSHFQILQSFCGRYSPTALGIPYTVTSDIGARPARIQVKDVIAGIESDMDAAYNIAAVPDAPTVIGTAGVIRLSKSVIAGMRARVAVYKASGLTGTDATTEWNKALTNANDCITKSGKTLATGANYTNIWTDDSESELLFKLRRAGTSVGTLWQDNNGDVFFEPSEKLKALFNRSTDARFAAFFDVNPAAADTCLVKKFSTSARGPKIVDVKVMRLSEMYLIRAEAKAEINDLTGAAADYNLLRQNRITGYAAETFNDKPDAIAKIYNERARELCFEGFRFFDHVRRGLAISRPAADVQSAAWQNLAAGDYRMLFPIPQASILANPNMVQNTGY